MQTYATKAVTIDLAGKTRQLRYSLSAVKSIKEKYGKEFTEIMAHPAEELLPVVLLVGCVDKEGLTEAVIAEDLTGPDIDHFRLKFIEAFFGQRLADVLAAGLKKQDELIRVVMETAVKGEEPVKNDPNGSTVQ